MSDRALEQRPEPATDSAAGAQSDDSRGTVLPHPLLRPDEKVPRRRGWLVRRMLLLADVVGLTLAFLVTEAIMLAIGAIVDLSFELFLFAVTLPVWVVLAKVYGLYDRDEERTDHSTVDDLVGVFHLATVGIWILVVAGWSTDLAFSPLRKLVPFWVLTVVFVSGARVAARMYCHRRPSYLQNTVVVGAGDVGQLVARKLMQHPEYGIKLVGFVDGDARGLRYEVQHLPILGGLDELLEIVKRFEIERVLVAFSGESEERTLALVRGLDEFGVQVDIVPRLFEVVGPNVGIHTVEGIALLGLPPARPSRSSRWIKRGIDVLGASIGLLLTLPLIAFIAWRIKRTSPGPVFFRQERLGLNMEPFSILKFRTMRVDTDDAAHREYISATMSSNAAPGANGIYKLDRGQAVTSIGRWLRKTSLDELPQLINVLRGEMSLVGPRPCLAYETEHFAPHHFERFVVPPGLTGLWQVTARAHSTFGEALEMDVAYVRGRSLGLDLSLLCRTPLQLGRGQGTT